VAEDHWQQARLIPTSGISGQEEAERRASSALLAVMGAVREFGLALVKPLGAPAGTIATDALDEAAVSGAFDGPVTRQLVADQIDHGRRRASGHGLGPHPVRPHPPQPSCWPRHRACPCLAVLRLGV
jgi:hypothetical protein